MDSARRQDEATRELRSVLEIDRDFDGALQMLGLALVETAQYDEAIRVLERVVSHSDGNPWYLGSLASAYARAGRRPEALRIVDEMRRLRMTRYVTPGAFVYAYLGLALPLTTRPWPRSNRATPRSQHHDVAQREPARRHLRQLDRLVPLHQAYARATREVAGTTEATLCDVADAAARMAPRVRRSLFRPDSIHFSAAGDRVIGELVARCIRPDAHLR